MGTLEKPTTKTTTACAITQTEPFLSTHNPLVLLRMSFAMRPFTLGFPIYRKNLSMTQQGLWVKSLTNSKEVLPDFEEDEPWHDETIEEYK